MRILIIKFVRFLIKENKKRRQIQRLKISIVEERYRLLIIICSPPPCLITDLGPFIHWVSSVDTCWMINIINLAWCCNEHSGWRWWWVWWRWSTIIPSRNKFIRWCQCITTVNCCRCWTGWTTTATKNQNCASIWITSDASSSFCDTRSLVLVYKN